LRRPAILPTAEDFRQGCLRPLLPGVNLTRMELVLRGDLVEGLLNLQRHLRFELFAVLITFHLDTPFAQSLYLKVVSQIRGPLYNIQMQFTTIFQINRKIKIGQ